jgi:prophage regulatory protein
MPKLLRFDELHDHGIVYGRRQVDRLEKQGKFPQRVPVGDNRVAWIADEIKAYVADKIKQARPGKRSGTDD